MYVGIYMYNMYMYVCMCNTFTTYYIPLFIKTASGVRDSTATDFICIYTWSVFILYIFIFLILLLMFTKTQMAIKQI